MAFKKVMTLPCDCFFNETAWSPNGKHLLVGLSMGGRVQLWTECPKRPQRWDLACVVPSAPEKSRRHDVAVAWAPDSTQFVASFGSNVQLWTQEKRSVWQLGQTLKGHTDSVECVAWTRLPNGKTEIVTSSLDNTVRVWTLEPNGLWETAHVLQMNPLEERLVCRTNTVSRSQDGNHIAVCEPDGAVRLWTADATGQWQATQRLHASDKIVRAAWSPVTNLLLCSTFGTQQVFRPNPEGEMIPAEILPFDKRMIMQGKWSPDGQQIACARVNRIYLWSKDANSNWQRDPDLNIGVSAEGVSWSPDGNRLAICTREPQDGDPFLFRVQVWDRS